MSSFHTTCIGSGSSPRMRGKRQPADGLGESLRIIPAHAGQTFDGGLIWLFLSDHPRACGANVACSICSSAFFGSSPRMRGKRIPVYPYCREIRIIPAHAGQTDRKLPSNSSSTDHPRACGANCHVCYCLRLGAGSSPRMRGKLPLNPEYGLQWRIIPAHAGQTRYSV